MTWTLEHSHSRVGFSASQLVIGHVEGEFTDFDVDVVLDPEQPEQSRVSAIIATASLTTGVGLRDADLKSPASSMFAASPRSPL